MSFSQLPAELQIHIFSYLDAQDLKAIRGVSLELRDHASEFLFQSVVACARYQALGAFQKVSRHAVFPKYVKEIIFDGSSYNKTLAETEYTYKQVADQFDQLRDLISWERWTRFNRYRGLYKDQQEMIEGHVLLQEIARGLESMPNICSVVYSAKPRFIPAEAKYVKETIPRGVGIPTLAVADSATLHAGFHQLIGAIYISQYNGIREFTVERIHRLTANTPGTEFTLSAFEFLNSDHINAGKYFFRHLTNINLDISLSSLLSRHTAGARALESLKNMAVLLSEAKGLCHLSFSLSSWDPSPHRMYGHIIPHGQPIFSHLGLAAKWPKLEFLSLEGLYADEEDLQDLISQHRDTLKVLKFTFCSLFTGNWSNLVEEVVYGTTTAFVLDRVNEIVIGDARFASMTDNEMKDLQYRGQVKVNQEGERYFDEPSLCKSVFAWRQQTPSEV